MASLPRIITVDSSGSIARIVRSAMDLLNLSIVQIDVPSASMALDEMENVNLVVCAYVLDLDDKMKGVEFALRVKQASPDTAILIIADEDDIEMDEETLDESPFVFLSRPLDVHQFIRVVLGGLESQEAMKVALKAPAKSGGGGGGGAAPQDLGPIPDFNMDAAVEIVDVLLKDLGAMAIILADRSGQTLIERGAIGYIDKDELATAMQPLMLSNIDMKEIVGGQVTTVQFIDGDDYDVYVLSIGLHHFMCVMFDGQAGSRQFGGVNRYGRRAVEDLIALLGANAFFIQKAAPQPAAPVAPPKRIPDKKRKTEETERVELEPATFDLPGFEEEEEQESEPLFEAIPDDEFNLDDIFGSDVSGDADDLFDLDKMEELAKQSEQKSGTLSWEDASDYGILKG